MCSARAALPVLDLFPGNEPPEGTPAEEAFFLRVMRDRFARNPKFADAALVMGMADGQPVVQIEAPTGDTVQLSVQPDGIGMRAVRDGYETTDDLDGDLREALDALVVERGVPKPLSPGSPGARREHAQTRTNSVEVRRATVRRV